MIQQIPLSDAVDQIQSIAIDGVLYNLRVRLNYRMQIWTLDILDSANTPILYGVLLVPGADIMLPYNIGLTGLYAVNLNDVNAYLSTEELSQHGGLYVDG